MLNAVRNYVEAGRQRREVNRQISAKRTGKRTTSKPKA
jgi:hypothetical protein